MVGAREIVGAPDGTPWFVGTAEGMSEIVGEKVVGVDDGASLSWGGEVGAEDGASVINTKSAVHSSTRPVDSVHVKSSSGHPLDPSTKQLSPP